MSDRVTIKIEAEDKASVVLAKVRQRLREIGVEMEQTPGAGSGLPGTVERLGTTAGATSSRISRLESDINEVRRATLGYRRSLTDLNAELATNQKKLLSADAAARETIQTRNKQIRAEQGLLRVQQQRSSLALSTLTQEKRELGGLSGAFRGAAKSGGLLVRAGGELAGTLGAIGVTEIAFGVARFGANAARASIQIDSATRALGVLTGSASEAERTMRDLQDLADEPGLTFRQASAGVVALRAIGAEAETTTRILRELGNAAAFSGGAGEFERGLLGFRQIIQRGRVSQEELNQLTENIGLVSRVLKEEFGTVLAEDIQAQLDATGQSIDDFVERTLIGFEKLERFPLDAPSVKLKNLSNSFFEFQAAVGDRFLPVVASGAEGLTKFFDTLTRFISGTDAAKESVEAFTTALTSADTAIARDDAIQNRIRFLREYIEELKEAKRNLGIFDTRGRSQTEGEIAGEQVELGRLEKIQAGDPEIIAALTTEVAVLNEKLAEHQQIQTDLENTASRYSKNQQRRFDIRRENLDAEEDLLVQQIELRESELQSAQEAAQGVADAEREQLKSNEASKVAAEAAAAASAEQTDALIAQIKTARHTRENLQKLSEAQEHLNAFWVRAAQGADTYKDALLDLRPAIEAVTDDSTAFHAAIESNLKVMEAHIGNTDELIAILPKLSEGLTSVAADQAIAAGEAKLLNKEVSTAIVSMKAFIEVMETQQRTFQTPDARGAELRQAASGVYRDVRVSNLRSQHGAVDASANALNLLDAVGPKAKATSESFANLSDIFDTTEKKTYLMVGAFDAVADVIAGTTTDIGAFGESLLNVNPMAFSNPVTGILEGLKFGANLITNIINENREREAERQRQRREAEARGLERRATYDRGVAELAQFRLNLPDVEALGVKAEVEAYLEQVRTAIIAGADIDWNSVRDTIEAIIKKPVEEMQRATAAAIETFERIAATSSSDADEIQDAFKALVEQTLRDATLTDEEKQDILNEARDGLQPTAASSRYNLYQSIRENQERGATHLSGDRENTEAIARSMYGDEAYDAEVRAPDATSPPDVPSTSDAPIRTSLERAGMNQALFDLSQSTSEQDFEANRQAAIAATQAYYDAEAERIDQLDATEDELQAKRINNSIARQKSLEALYDKENTFTTERIKGEEAVQAAIEESTRKQAEAAQQRLALDADIAANTSASAKFALDRATSEADFETKRKAAIEATTAYYAAEETRIKGLGLSEAALAIEIDTNNRNRIAAVEALTSAENRYTTERIRGEEAASEAARKAEEERQKSLAAAEAARQKAVEKDKHLDLELARNRVQLARDVLSQSPTEASFESNRQAAIDAENAYHDLWLKNATEKITNEKEILEITQDIELSRTQSLRRLSDAENKYTTQRIDNEKAVAEAALAEQERLHEESLRLQEERDAAIRKTLDLQQERASLGVDLASYALDGAKDEIDFELKRKILIAEITKAHKAQLDIIENLKISDEEKALKREAAELRYQKTLDRTNKITNHFEAERIRQAERAERERVDAAEKAERDRVAAAEKAEQAIQDLKDKQIENEQDRLEKIEEATADHAENLKEIHEDLNEDLLDLEEDRLDKIQDLHEKKSDSLIDLRTRIARSMFDASVSFDDLTEEQQQSVLDSIEYRRGQHDINKRHRRGMREERERTGILDPGSAGHGFYMEELRAGRLTDPGEIENLFGSQGKSLAERFIENKDAAAAEHQTKIDDINTEAEATATALATKLGETLASLGLDALLEAITKQGENVTKDGENIAKQGETADKESTTADKAETATDTFADAVGPFADAISDMITAAEELKGAARVQGLKDASDRLVAAADRLLNVPGAFEKVNVPGAFEKVLTAITSSFELLAAAVPGHQKSLLPAVSTVNRRRSSVSEGEPPMSEETAPPADAPFHYKETDKIARAQGRALGHEAVRLLTGASPDHIRSAKDQNREFREGASKVFKETAAQKLMRESPVDPARMVQVLSRYATPVRTQSDKRAIELGYRDDSDRQSNLRMLDSLHKTANREQAQEIGKVVREALAKVLPQYTAPSPDRAIENPVILHAQIHTHTKIGDIETVEISKQQTELDGEGRNYGSG